MKRLKLFDENGSVEKKFKRQPCLFNKILRDSQYSYYLEK